MEDSRNTSQNLLLHELSRAEELGKQLQVHREHCSSCNLHMPLASDLMVCIEKAIGLVKSSNHEDQEKPSTDSWLSASGSPRSENSDRQSKDQEPRIISKKRKMTSCTKKVKITAGGEQSALDDGYHWRKYGQKEIQGAQHPRAYYRCTHRTTYGCQATKQVQKTDDDPSVFHVTYYGNHTCHQNSHLVNTATLGENEQQEYHLDSEHPDQHHQLLLSFQTELKVNNNSFISGTQDQACSSFSFPLMSVNCSQDGTQLLSASNLNNCLKESSSLTNFSQMSSESKYYINTGHNLQMPESQLTDIISPTASTTNSSMLDMAFTLDPNYPFDASSFLS